MNEWLDRIDFGFFEPWWLLAGFVALIAVTLLEIGAHRRRVQALRLFIAPHLAPELASSISQTKRLVKRLLLVGGVACLFIALARPHMFYRWEEETRTGLDLMVAFDCSKSMLTEDVKPNRIERAKLAVADFADELPDDRLGLITFAGDAFLQVPLTLDHDAFQTAVRDLNTDTIPRPGTDVATAINQAITAFASQASNTKILLLVTDGEDLEGRAVAAAQNAAKAGIKIYTIGVGTANGDLIPERDDSGALMYLHDSNGQIVKSRLDESTLRQIAETTGGAYAPLGQQGEGLREIYQKYIATLPRHQVESRRQKIRFEQYEWPLGASILLLIASMLIGERSRSSAENFPTEPPAKRRGLKRAPVPLRQKAATAALLALALVPLHAAPADKAERAYKAGQYPQAEQNYQSAAASAPKRDDLKFNVGDAAYKAGEYSQAEDAFRQALETPDLGLQEKAYYNIGNSQFRQGESTEQADQKQTIKLWEQALKSYESAMKLHEAADTKHNWEYVKQRLEQLKQQQQQQQKNQQNKDNKNQQQSSSNSQDGKNGSGQPQQNQDNSGQKPDQQKNDQQNGGQPQQKNQQQGQQNQSQQPQNDEGQQPKTPEQMSKDANTGHSTSREKDQVDPGAKSQQEAEALLDSLKDDEKQITARSISNGNEPPPPPPSGKDW